MTTRPPDYRRPRSEPYAGRAYTRRHPLHARRMDGDGWPPFDEFPGPPRHRGPRAFDAGRPERRRHPPERRGDWRGRWERLRERTEERPWVQRGREFLRRYREPIIGLTIAGAAAPIAQAGREAPRPLPREIAEREAARPAVEPGAIEEEVGRRWAAERGEQRRADTIEGAMIRYGIDRRLAEDIYDDAVAEGIEPDIAFGLVNTESAFDHRAISNVGARGLTQIMPRTARWLNPGTTVEDLYDRNINLRMGFGYLRDLIDKYNGDTRLALLAYNRGPGTVDRVLERGGDPDNGYADRVLSG